MKIWDFLPHFSPLQAYHSIYFDSYNCNLGYGESIHKGISKESCTVPLQCTILELMFLVKNEKMYEKWVYSPIFPQFSKCLQLILIYNIVKHVIKIIGI